MPLYAIPRPSTSRIPIIPRLRARIGALVVGMIERFSDLRDASELVLGRGPAGRAVLPIWRSTASTGSALRGGGGLKLDSELIAAPAAAPAPTGV